MMWPTLDIMPGNSSPLNPQRAPISPFPRAVFPHPGFVLALSRSFRTRPADTSTTFHSLGHRGEQLRGESHTTAPTRRGEVAGRRHGTFIGRPTQRTDGLWQWLLKGVHQIAASGSGSFMRAKDPSSAPGVGTSHLIAEPPAEWNREKRSDA